MSGIVYWIWLAQRHLGVKSLRLLLDTFAGPKEIFFAGKQELKRLGKLTDGEIGRLMDKNLTEAEAIIAKCLDEQIGILTMQDAMYPERLRNIADPPLVLYIKGSMPAVDSEALVAVVGTRKCTPYGEKQSMNMGYEIARLGGIVVTGLAAGIDSRAAEGALMGDGRVIGVLGTGINVVFPANNRRLFDDVAARGALISEYPPDTPGSKITFPARNRIIAGLSLAVVVPEAPLRSGALITARLALDYGRDVFALPGNVDSPACRGSNNLLREGASFAESGWDVLKEYKSRFPDKIGDGEKPATPREKPSVPKKKEKPGAEAQPLEAAEEVKAEAPKRAEEIEGVRRGFFKLRAPNKAEEKKKPTAIKQQLEGLTENQLKIVAAMTKPSMHVDDIIDLSGLPASVVLSEMTMLQLKGFISPENGKRYTLNIAK